MTGWRLTGHVACRPAKQGGTDNETRKDLLQTSQGSILSGPTLGNRYPTRLLLRWHGLPALKAARSSASGCRESKPQLVRGSKTL